MKWTEGATGYHCQFAVPVEETWYLSELDLVNKYEANNKRKAYSVMFADKMNSWCITKFSDWSDTVGTLGYDWNDWNVPHCADAMLMMTEAYERLVQDEQAIGYLNEVYK